MMRKRDDIWYALRRRKVVQWGIAYVAGALGLLQVIENVGDAFGWPGELRQIAILVLLTGLPVVLVIAWYHGDRGEQLVTSVELAIIAAVFVVGGGVLWRYGPTVEQAVPRQSAAAHSLGSSTAAISTRPTVAVVPFTNLTADPANDYLADGIAETLMTMLAQVGELNVIGPASSFSLKGSIEDPRVVGLKLGAAALLAGSVQRDDNHIRVSAQLVETTDGRQLWAATYDRPESDIFAVQDAIATEVTRALSIALAGRAGLGAIGTQDVAAYDHYLRGKQLIEQRVSGSIEDGIAALEISVDRDPTFARAWAELAMGYLLVSTEASRTRATGSRSIERARDLAKLAAHRAVEIAPELGAAHAALAQYHSSAGQEAAALAAVAKAVELSPDDPWCLTVLAGTLRDSGRPEAALASTRRALQLDPRNWRLRLNAGRTFDAVGDRISALRQYREAIRLDPDLAIAYFVVGQTLSDMVGQTDLALRFLRKARSLDPDDTATQRALLDGYMRVGHRKFAKQLLESRRRGAAHVDHHPALEVDEYLDGSQGRIGAIESTLAGRHPATTAATKGTIPRVRRATTEVAMHSRRRPRQRVGEWILRGATPAPGRTEVAIDELDRLLAQGSGLHGWRDLAVDPAYENLRDHPRFKAIVTHLKSVSDGELKRFRARPDLNDSDIEALGRRIDLADRGLVVTNRDQLPAEWIPDTGATRKAPTRP